MREPGEISATCHHWSPRTRPHYFAVFTASALLDYHISSFSEIVAGAGQSAMLGSRLTTKRPARRYLRLLQNHGLGSTRPYIKPSISKGSPRTPLQSRRAVQGVVEM